MGEIIPSLTVRELKVVSDGDKGGVIECDSIVCNQISIGDYISINGAQKRRLTSYDTVDLVIVQPYGGHIRVVLDDKSRDLRSVTFKDVTTGSIGTSGYITYIETVGNTRIESYNEHGKLVLSQSYELNSTGGSVRFMYVLEKDLWVIVSQFIGNRKSGPLIDSARRLNVLPDYH